MIQAVEGGKNGMSIEFHALQESHNGTRSKCERDSICNLVAQCGSGRKSRIWARSGRTETREEAADMALTPWPKFEPELTAAVQSLAAAAFGDSAKDRLQAQRLGPVGSDLVEKYSPHAPQSVRDEAVILVVSWIGQHTSGLTPGLEIKAGGITLSRRRYRGEISALRHSGAMSLLSSMENPAGWQAHS